MALLLILIVLNLILQWLSGEERLNKIIRLLLWLGASFAAICFGIGSLIVLGPLICWLDTKALFTPLDTRLYNLIKMVEYLICLLLIAFGPAVFFTLGMPLTLR